LIKESVDALKETTRRIAYIPRHDGLYVLSSFRTYNFFVLRNIS